MSTPPPPRHREEPPWAKYFVVGVSVTVLDLLLYPYLKQQMTGSGSLVPYISWASLLFFLLVGTAIGYLIAWKRASGYATLVPTGAVLGIVVGYELAQRDPTLMVALMVGVAASGLSILIGSLF
ncbi:MAG: hypothetical protein KGJ23_07470 [Euryarchaeota archaeon]|nr:hypothetical protein [Euryarchaeota archaeon]MDE1836438.1 hypothetical protein [Euryarchaeota archaeon]MDE1879047.1 hypothetical protein [Euryarchaeota archaeon]MDE2044186.1 hypothetical protein [Thermoplasmata archaeon]